METKDPFEVTKVAVSFKNAIVNSMDHHQESPIAGALLGKLSDTPLLFH